MLPSPSDDELFARWCRRADVEALAMLFDRLTPRLFRLAVHLVGDPVEAEDVVQSTFLAAIEARDRIDTARPAAAWLTGVLKHKAIDRRRARGRRAEIESPDLDGLAIDTDDASDAAERRELSRFLRAPKRSRR